MDERFQLLIELSQYQYNISEENVRRMITAIKAIFRTHLVSNGFTLTRIDKLATKFNDAGRRSAPWRAASGRIPGRPQDGSDGNRRSRWLFEPDHKFYANEVMATLVEVKYFLQTLSMVDAPPLPADTIQEAFLWLTKHRIEPGVYRDPIQLIPMSLKSFIEEPRSVESGHFVPLDRGGRHVPDNTFLMLARSNKLQGNLTLQELIELMEEIVRRHRNAESTHLVIPG
jgi:hypothetical protein